MSVNLNDLNCHEYVPHEWIIDKISEEIDTVGADLPIKDGLKNDKAEGLTDDEAENKLNLNDPEDLANHRRRRRSGKRQGLVGDRIHPDADEEVSVQNAHRWSQLAFAGKMEAQS